MPGPLIIAGASARAAAQSAVRAGMQVTAADMFCDRDLADCCPAQRVPNYPQGILGITGQIPPTEWMYTGGLENEPDLVDAVSQRHTLLGHAGHVLRRVRDPWQLAHVLGRQKLLYPQPQREPPTDAARRWLLKPQRSCGGLRIGWFDPPRTIAFPARMLGQDLLPGEDRDAESIESHRPGCGLGDDGSWYYQPWIDGVSLAAVFLAAAGAAVLLGVTRQLVGSRWAGAHGFRYVGSIGPLELDGEAYRRFERIGNCLAEAFSLKGVFGIDTVASGSDVWTIEVNPRLTASVEILERATGLSVTSLHRDVCRGAPLPAYRLRDAGPWYGKAVLYAATDCVIDRDFYQRLNTVSSPDRRGRFADLPRIGTRIPAGHPVLTTFAQGPNLRAVHRELRFHARLIREMLAPRNDLSRGISSAASARGKEASHDGMA
ncbi:MAG: ATP-grasp domain-containing protein [Pirellulaceae bacterium]